MASARVVRMIRGYTPTLDRLVHEVRLPDGSRDALSRIFRDDTLALLVDCHPIDDESTRQQLEALVGTDVFREGLVYFLEVGD